MQSTSTLLKKNDFKKTGARDTLMEIEQLIKLSTNNPMSSFK